MPVRARRVEVTEEATNFGSTDYASAFEVTVRGTDVRSPEQWARAIFEEAPKAMRWFVLVGWKYVLGLRLGPRLSPSHVLGWKIVSMAPDTIVLDSRSALMTAHKVLRVHSTRIVVTTFVRYERRPAQPIWLAVAPVHHRTEPYFLGHAAAHPQ
jgi:hypothetical protein